MRVGSSLLNDSAPRLPRVEPRAVLNYFSLDAYVGDEIDFANVRKGSGTTSSAA